MPVNNYFHGARTIESGPTPTLFELPNSSVTALIGTAPDADPDLFPLNRPVGFVSQISVTKLLTETTSTTVVFPVASVSEGVKRLSGLAQFLCVFNCQGWAVVLFASTQI